MVGRVQPTFIMRYPELKAIVDGLIAQGFGNELIAQRVRDHRNLQRYPCPETIRTYRGYVAEQQQGGQVDAPKEDQMEHAPEGQAPEELPAEHGQAGDLHQGARGNERAEYLTLIEILGFFAVVLLPHLRALW